MMDKIKTIRNQIDNIDRKIHQLINQRANLAIEVSKQKINAKESLGHFYRPEREMEIFNKIKKYNQGPLADDRVLLIFREIMSACLALESPLRVSFLGPIGTFTQEAAYKHFGKSILPKPLNTIESVFRSVEMNNADFGVVPVENSNEGVVSSTLDCLQKSSLNICGEVQIPIDHYLLVKDKTVSIKKIYAHPQSFAQCKSFLTENFPGCELESVASNALGAKLAATEPNSAAIASKIAADLYQLEILESSIQDRVKNNTRFLVVGKYLCQPSDNDKTSLLLSVGNTPGALYSMLKPFEKYEINMSKIESRPSKVEDWVYVFFIDVDCHMNNENFVKAIEEIKERHHFVRILGSYPKRMLT